MIIEPKWLKKIKSRIHKKVNEFFLTYFGFHNTIEGFYEISSLKQRVVIIPTLMVIRRVGRRVSEMKHTEKQNRVFSTPKRCHMVFQSLLNLSVNFAKRKYPRSWKTIFVHWFQKNDWLIRSDNNTGCSSTKILQTTII